VNHSNTPAVSRFVQPEDSEKGQKSKLGTWPNVYVPPADTDEGKELPAGRA
jgi:hypothetical protein